MVSVLKTVIDKTLEREFRRGSEGQDRGEEGIRCKLKDRERS